MAWLMVEQMVTLQMILLTFFGKICKNLRNVYIFVVAFGNKVAKVYTTPLNKRATCASALPMRAKPCGDPYE